MPLGHASGGEEEEEEEKETSTSYSLAQGPLLVVALMCQIEGGRVLGGTVASASKGDENTDRGRLRRPSLRVRVCV